MRVKIRRSQYEVRTTKIQHELSMKNSLWNSEGAQRGGSAKYLLHFVFHLEANLTLPFALGLSYKTFISYKPSSKKSPKTWTVSAFKKCMKSFSMLFLQPRENEDAVLLLSGERKPPVCPLQKAMEGKDQACQSLNHLAQTTTMNEIAPAHCPIAGSSWFFLPFLPSSAWQGILDYMCQEHGSVHHSVRPPSTWYLQNCHSLLLLYALYHLLLKFCCT